MEALLINGGERLRGTVAIGGAKNAALPIMAASILAGGPVRLRNVPQLLDVDRMSLLLGGLGVEVDYERDRRATFRTRDSRPTTADARLVRSMRASFCVLGPLLAKRGRALVPLPGGCRIGARPVDVHLRGLTALGAEVSISGGCVRARAKRLRGATIDLMGSLGPSVTGTANVLCAATLAEGVTLLKNVAREPEVEDLCRFLNSLGARISGMGSSALTIDGVSALGGVDHTLIPDRIEAITWLAAAAVTGGCATLTNVEPLDLIAAVDALRGMGCHVVCVDGQIEIAAPPALAPFRFEAQPHPGLPTDVQAMFTALALKAEGTSTIVDNVFPKRFGHVRRFRRFGASIRMRGNAAVVRGGKQLIGAAVDACDLRAGAALALAGLTANGQTLLRGLHHLDRGYEGFAAKLRSLGADIDRGQITRSTSHKLLAVA